MEIKDLTALELSKEIQSGRVSVQEALKSTLEEISKKEKNVHAYLNVWEKEALSRAKIVEKEIREGRLKGSLAGVPVAVKDNICTKGMETTCASRMLKGFRPPYQAEAVSRLLEAGAVIVGKTNMDEFAMGSTTETSAFGVTRNPWNPDHVPGGSSGGSCAAVAAGECYLALGSDTGGSIRQPASHCGVVGLKPTYGTVSRSGLIAYGSSLDQIGPVGKTVSDCAAALEVVASWDRKDSTSLNRGPLGLLEELEAFDGSLHGMRIGVPKEFLSKGVQREVQQAVADAVELLTRRGAQIEFFSLELTDYAIPTYYIIASAEASSNLSRFDGVKYGYRAIEAEDLHKMYRMTRSKGFGEEVKRRIMLGSFVLSSGYYDAYYLKALKAKTLIKQAFDRAFERFDVILGPVAPTSAPKIGESLQDPLSMYLGDIYTVLANLAALPAISVPALLDDAGLPVGIQLMSDCFQEKKLLRAAKAFEEERGELKTHAPKEEPSHGKVSQKAAKQDRNGLGEVTAK